MKRAFALVGATALLGTILTLGTGIAVNASQQVCTPDPGFNRCFVYGASEEGTDFPFAVPAGVTSIEVRAWGSGGNMNGTPNLGGPGGFANGTVAVQPGTIVRVAVNVGGYGGFSGVFTGPGRRGGAQIIAGGGGGAGAGHPGGGGGGTSGGMGGGLNGGGGGGGTQTTGGTIKPGCSYGDLSAGDKFRGGGGSGFYGGQGGAGGGGFYGGGGGCWDAGGGGGSSYVTGPLVSEGTTISAAGTTPGGATDSHYVAGVGMGNSNGTGSNGQVVIQFVDPVIPTTTLPPTTVERYIVSTVAGNGSSAPADGPANSAGFSYPYRLARDPLGNLYITDGYAVRKVATDGSVTTIAGNGEYGFAEGLGTAARFSFLDGIVIDSARNLFVADQSNNRIRKITPEGVVSTFAGSANSGSTDGPGATALFDQPGALAIASNGDLYVAEKGGLRIRKITSSGEVSTFATGIEYPTMLYVDAAGNVYFGDQNAAITKYSPSGEPEDFAGNYGGATTGPVNGFRVTAKFAAAQAMAEDANGNLFVADGSAIRKISPNGMVATVIGDYTGGFADGPSETARFSYLGDISLDPSGEIYVTDSGSYRVRKLVPAPPISTSTTSTTTTTTSTAPTTTTTVEPTTTTVEPTTTTVEPTTTTVEPTTTTVEPTTTTVEPTTTTVEPATSTTTSTMNPSSTTISPSTTTPTTTELPSTSVPSTTAVTTSTSTGPTTSAVPSTTTASTTTAIASTSTAPSATTISPPTPTTSPPTTSPSTTSPTTTMSPTTTATTSPPSTTPTTNASTSPTATPTTVTPTTVTPSTAATPIALSGPTTTHPSATLVQPSGTDQPSVSDTTALPPTGTSTTTSIVTGQLRPASATRATVTTTTTTATIRPSTIPLSTIRTTRPTTTTNISSPTTLRLDSTQTTLRSSRPSALATTTTTRPARVVPSSTIPTDQPLDSTTTQPQTTQPTTTETPTTTPSTPRSTVATPANAGNDVASNNAAGTEEASNDIGSNGGTGTDQANGSSDPTTTKATRNPDKVGGTGTSDETSNASTSIGENAPDELALTDDQSMRIDLRAKVGDMAANRDGQVDASGLKPGTVLIVEVHSTPIEVARLTVARDGTASGSFKLPESLEDGNHRIITHGVLPNGSQIGRDYAFLVDKERIAEVAAPVGGLYPVRAFGNAPDQLAFYAPVNDVNHVLHTQGQFFAMVTAAGAAAVAVRGSRGSRSRSTVKAAGTRTSLREDVGSGSNATKDSGSDNSREYSEVFAADAVFEVLDPDDRTLARGDRSRTWRWKGTSSVDRWSRDLPDPINRFSPLVARVITDGQWLRAAIGPLALLLPFVGAVLGVAAGFKAGGTYLPPAIAWIVVLLVLGIFDAAAGAVAGLSYLIVTVATGGMPTADNMRATAGLLTLWFAPALAAAMIRPVRRVLDGSRASKIERVADCIIGPMCGAWTAQNAIWAQSGLSGRQLPIGNYLGRLTLLAGGCLLVRYLLETAVLQWYPQRSAMTDAGEPDATSRIQQIISVSLRGLMFIGIATAFYPLSWQLVFGGVALSFSILVYLEWIGDRMPNLGFLHRFVPGELTYLAVLLVACDFITRRLPNWESDPQRQMLMGIVYYGIPGIALGLVVLFGREGKRPEWKQWHYALGIPMIAVLSKVMFFA